MSIRAQTTTAADLLKQDLPLTPGRSLDPSPERQLFLDNYDNDHFLSEEEGQIPSAEEEDNTEEAQANSTPKPRDN